MIKLFVLGFVPFFLAGCSQSDEPQIQPEIQPEESYIRSSEQESEPCLNYSDLNYTTLKISEADLKKLSCFRQKDWLNGVCYPEDCGVRNPPVCKSVYAIKCFNPDSEEYEYFKYQRIGGGN